MRFLVAGLLSLALVCCEKARANSVKLDWHSSASPAVAGYNVYYGTISGNYLYKVDVGNATSVTISNLIPGFTYYFAATAYDSTGHESAYSPEITFRVGYVLNLSKSDLPGSPAMLQFQVEPGNWYQIQASTDLRTWTNIWQSVTATSAFLFLFADPNAGSYRSRYYRLVVHTTGQWHPSSPGVPGGTGVPVR